MWEIRTSEEGCVVAAGETEGQAWLAAADPLGAGAVDGYWLMGYVRKLRGFGWVAVEVREKASAAVDAVALL